MASKKVPVSSASLSMTLPISCQICLGKVREPVVCPNQHVFCSTCMDLWLRTHSFCPTCRTSITTEKPCKKILGSIDLPVNSDAATRAELRRTRLELIRREYEDELKSLQSTVERLKSENKQLHEKMIERERTMANMEFNPRYRCKEDDGTKIDIDMLVKLTTRLQEASHTYENLRTDMEKVKEDNKKLQEENRTLIKENSRLKDEPQFSRSPQRYSHYTMAGLQTKVGQYEREVQQLRRALKRSDNYIEDLTTKLDRGSVGQSSSKRPHLRTSPVPSSCTITSLSNDKEGAETSTNPHPGSDIQDNETADPPDDLCGADNSSQKNRLATGSDTGHVASNGCHSPVLPPVCSERYSLEAPSSSIGREERPSMFSSRRSSEVSAYGQDLDIPPGPLTAALNVLEPVENESLDRPPSRGELLLLGDPSTKQAKPAPQENLNMFTASRQLMLLSERRMRHRETYEPGRGREREREIGNGSPASSDGDKRKSVDSKSLDFDVFASTAAENSPDNPASQDSPPHLCRDETRSESPILHTFSLAKIKAEIEGGHDVDCPLKRPKLENEFLEDTATGEEDGTS